MEKKLRKKSIGRICALAMIGVFMVMTSMSVPADDPDDWTKDGDSWGADARLGSNDNYAVIFETNGNDRMTITNGGKVGIGTTSPDGPLHVKGTTLGVCVLTIEQNDVSDNNPVIAFKNEGGELSRVYADESDDLLVLTAATETGLILDNAGNVRIGTSGLPSAQLELYKASGDPTLAFDIGGTDVWTIRVDDSDSDKFFIETTGINYPVITGEHSTANVGIGTLSPDGRLDIEKEGTARSNLDILHITNSGCAVSMANTRTSILFNQWYWDDPIPAVADAGRITVGTETDWTSTASTQDGYMAFYTVNGGTVSEQVRITSDGNVGIGTTSPDTELHVDGDIKQKVTTSDVSNPPSDNELDILFGTPASNGDGWTTYLKDSNSNNFYQIVAVGIQWYIFEATLAT